MTSRLIFLCCLDPITILPVAFAGLRLSDNGGRKRIAPLQPVMPPRLSLPKPPRLWGTERRFLPGGFAPIKNNPPGFRAGAHMGMRDGWEKEQGQGAWIVGVGTRVVAGDGLVLPNDGAGALALPELGWCWRTLRVRAQCGSGSAGLEHDCASREVPFPQGLPAAAPRSFWASPGHGGTSTTVRFPAF